MTRFPRKYSAPFQANFLVVHLLVWTGVFLPMFPLHAARGAGFLKKGYAFQRQSAQNQNYVVIAGTVFRENGFSLPGATVILTLKNSDSSGSPKKPIKFKKLAVVSDARGEFAFRVSTNAAIYTVTASMKELQLDEKEVVIPEQGSPDRLDVTLILLAESKALRTESK